MAKKVKLDDYGFDSSMDMDSFSFDVPTPKDDRTPAGLKAAKAAAHSFKSTVTSTDFIRNMVKKSLPKDYEVAGDVATDSVDTLKSLYNDAAKEIKPLINDIKRTTGKILPSVSSVMPKSVSDKIKKWSTVESSPGYKDLSPEEQRTAALQMQLGDIFKMQTTAALKQDSEAKAKDSLNDAVNNNRHRDMIGQLDAMRVSLQQLAGYQSKIESNYQKKSLELQFRQYFIAQDSLSEMKRYNAISEANLIGILKNTGLPEFAKLKTSERLKEVMRNKFVDAAASKIKAGSSEFIKRVGSNIGKVAKEKISDFASNVRMGLDAADMMADMQSSMADMGMSKSKSETAGDLAGNFAATTIGGKLAKKINKHLGPDTKVGKFGAKAAHVAENIPGYLTDYANSDTYGKERKGIAGKALGLFDTDNKLGFLGDILRDSIKSANTLDNKLTADKTGNMQDPSHFSRGASKSVTEVIPGYLSRIYQELQIIRTGDDKIELTTFDFNSDKFSSKSKATRKIFNSIVGKGDTDTDLKREEINRLSSKGKLNAKEKKQLEDLKKTVSTDVTYTARDIDELISEIDKEGKLSKEQRKILGQKLLNDNLKNRSGSASRLSDVSSYTGDSAEHSEVYSKLFANHFKDDTDDRKQHQFSKKYNKLGAGINDQRKVIQDHLNTGNREILEELGIINPNTNDINEDKLMSYLSGLEDMPDLGSNSSASKVNKFSSVTPTYKPGKQKHSNTKSKLSRTNKSGEQVSHATTGIDNGSSILTTISETLLRIESKISVGIGFEIDEDKLKASMNKAGNYVSGMYGKGKAKFTRAKTDILNSKLYSNAKDKLNEFNDIFIEGEVKPRLLAMKLKAGVYRDEITKKIITSYKDIKNNVIDENGDVVLSMSDIKNSFIMSNTGKKLITALGATKAEGINLLNRLKPKLQSGITSLRDTYDKLTTSKENNSEPELSNTSSNNSNTINDTLLRIEKRLNEGINVFGTSGGNVVKSGKGWNMSLKDAGKGILGLGMKGINTARNIGSNMFNRATGILGSGIGIGRDIAAKVGTHVLDKARGIRDVYIPGENLPRMLATKIKAGHYKDKNTGRVISNYKSITGAVIDELGNIVLTDEEAKTAYVKELLGAKLIKALGATINTVRGFLGGAIGRLPVIYQAGINLVMKAYGLTKLPQDVYTKDKPDVPALLAKSMKAGGYTSRITGKVIHHPGEIDGAVLDDKGNEVLTAEEFAKGIYDSRGKPIRTGLNKIFGTAKDIAMYGINKARKIGSSIINRAGKTLSGIGSFVKNNVRVGVGIGGLSIGNTGMAASDSGTANIMITRLTQIRDLVNLSLSANKRQKFNDGESDKKLKLNSISAIGGGIKNSFNKFKTKVGGFFGKKSPEELAAINAQTNTDIKNLLKDRLPKTASIKERVGSYADLMRKKKDSLLDKAKTTSGIGKAGGIGGAIMGGIKGLFGKKDEENGLLDTAEQTVADKAAGGLWSGAKKLGSKALSIGKWGLGLIPGLGLGGGATAAAGAVAEGAGAAAIGGGGIMAGIGGALTGIASFLASPVVLGAAAVAAIGIGGYMAYKYLTRKKLTTLSKIRYAQYGFKPTDEDHFKALMELEDIVEKAVGYTKGKAEINESKLEVKKIVDVFGVDLEKKDEVANTIKWFNTRFKPVFLTHLTALNTVDARKTLGDVEDLEPIDKKKYLDIVKFPEGPYDFTTSPFSKGNSLEAGKSDVDNLVDAAYAEIKDATTKKKTDASGLAVPVAAAALADKNKAKDDKEKKPEDTSYFNRVKNSVKDAAKFAGNVTESIGVGIGVAAGNLKDFSKSAITTVKNVGESIGVGISTVGKQIAEVVMPTKSAAEHEKTVIAAMNKAGIKDPKERAAFMATVTHETGDFRSIKEGNYKPDTVWKLRGNTLSKLGVTKEMVDAAYKTDGPGAMFNFMYGDKYRIGNAKMGNEGEADGALYKGRGYIQLTGKNNYSKMGSELGLDLVNQPQLLEDPNVAADATVQYWKDNNIGQKLAMGGMPAVNQAVNGGPVGKTVGEEDRDKRFEKFLRDPTVTDPNAKPGATTAGLTPPGTATTPGDATLDKMPNAADTSVKSSTSGIMKASLTTTTPVSNATPVTDTQKVDVPQTLHQKQDAKLAAGFRAALGIPTTETGGINAAPVANSTDTTVDSKSTLAPDVLAASTGFISPKANDVLAQKKYEKDLHAESLGSMDETLSSSLSVQKSQLEILSKIFEVINNKQSVNKAEVVEPVDTTKPSTPKNKEEMPKSPVSMKKMFI